MRVIDRIGKVDQELKKNSPNDDIQHTGKESSEIGLPDNPNVFIRSTTVPNSLQQYQPQEVELSNPVTKLIKKQFEKVNSKLINMVRSGNQNRRFNLPKKTRDEIPKSRRMVSEKKIHISKADKGDTIFVIDYTERQKIEQMNIANISKLCEIQSSNWKENREFIDNKMKQLFELKFITRKELCAVTGQLAGGSNGNLRRKDHRLKYTRATDMNELFTKQKTPYIYPLLKAHKLSMAEIVKIKPDEVCDKIPARLVVGMSSCQMSRVQKWLETFLSPLCKCYGSFEYVKDTNDILLEIENVNELSRVEDWNWEDVLLFTVDVKALYPSINIELLKTALTNCFTAWTNWSTASINTIIEIIIYTLNHQEVFWNNNYYMLNKGVPTGGKHCVPLANIFLTFIIRQLLESNTLFKNIFEKYTKMWKRFIDDCGGVFLGKTLIFNLFFKILEEQFMNYGLQLETKSSSSDIVLLDIEIFKSNGQLHTREHRKETSGTSYLKYGSAHASHTYKGIVKSQMYRLRRLCSRDEDFKIAVNGLRQRCLNSGYDKNMVYQILLQANGLQRRLRNTIIINNDKTKPDPRTIRWVTLAGTPYEKHITNFISQLNGSLKNYNIRFENIKTTAPSLKSLFNNNDKPISKCINPRCTICRFNLRGDNTYADSTVTQRKYKIDKTLTCCDSGIYMVTCTCAEQYTGKTTNFYSGRLDQHFSISTSSSIKTHELTCIYLLSKFDMKIQFLENSLSRGKYTLSEREGLWNERMKGAMNIQKTLIS